VSRCHKILLEIGILKMKTINVKRMFFKRVSFFFVLLGSLVLSSLVQAANYNSLEEGVDGEKSIFDVSPLGFDIEQHLEKKKKEEYQLIFDLLRTKKFSQADKDLAVVLEKYPKEVYFINLQALLKVMQKNATEARKNYLQVLQIDKKNLVAMLGLANLAIEQDKLDEANQYVDSAIKIEPSSMNAYLMSAKIAQKQNAPKRVERILLKVLEKNKGGIVREIRLISVLGKFYAQQKQLEKMLPISRELVNEYPGNVMALSTLAGAQLINKQIELAEKTLKQVVLKSPKDINHRFMLINMLGKQKGRENEAFILLEEVFRVNPNNLQALAMKATLELKLKKYQQASLTINNIANNYPSLAMAKQLTGDLFATQKKFSKALDAYKESYAIHENANTMNQIVDLMMILKQEESAVVFLQKAVEKNNNPLAHYILATFYQKKNQYKQVEEHYLAILKVKPDSYLVLNNLAWNYLQQNDLGKALTMAASAYKENPKSFAVLDSYGYILYKNGQLEKAESILEVAVDLEPDNYNVQFHLAEVYVANGKNNNARVLLDKITVENNGFSEQRAAIELLNKISVK